MYFRSWFWQAWYWAAQYWGEPGDEQADTTTRHPPNLPTATNTFSIEFTGGPKHLAWLYRKLLPEQMDQWRVLKPEELLRKRDAERKKRRKRALAYYLLLEAD